MALAARATDAVALRGGRVTKIRDAEGGPWPWLAPLILFIALFYLYPLVEVVRLSFTNAGGVGASAVAGATSGAPSATLLTTKNNSLVFGVGNDWDHAIARVPGPNQTLVHQFLAPVDDTYWVQRVVPAVAVSGTRVTLNDAAPTADRWNLALVEIVSR